MTDQTCVAFHGDALLAKGSLAAIAAAIKTLPEAYPMVLVFDAQTGRPIDLDLRNPPPESVPESSPESSGPHGRSSRGRPKLGVVAREVTLLPRHWDWLAQQPGGASAALRKLVEAAARNPQAQRQAARDAAYRLMSALAGDRPHFEAAARALFAGDVEGFSQILAQWPADVAAQIHILAAPAFASR